MKKSKDEREPGTPSGKVVSIVPGIAQKRVQELRARAKSTHLRGEEIQAEAKQNEATLEGLDLDEGIAACEEQDTREARVAWAELRSLRAMRSCLRGDVEAGLREWGEVVAAEPGIAAVYLMRQSWLSRSDMTAALADCERAVAAEPKNPTAYARRGDCHRVLGDTDRAIADYRRAVGLDPKLFDVHYTLGTVYQGLGRHEEARVAYTKAIHLAPDYVEPYIGRATAHALLGDHASCLRDFDRVLELDPKRDDVRDARAQILAKLGEIADARLAAFAAEHGEESGDAPMYTTAGKTHLALGDKDKALAAFEHALGLDPDDVTALAARGALLWERDENARSLADFDRAAKLAPRDPDHHVGRAKALAKLGRMADAVAAASRAIALDPDHVLAHRVRAVFRSHAEEGDAACAAVAADLRRAWELMPRAEAIRAEYLDYIVDQLGRVDEAIAVLDEAIRLEPRSAKLYYERARHKIGRDEIMFDNDVEDDETEEQARARLLSGIADLEEALSLGERTEEVHWELVRARGKLMGNRIEVGPDGRPLPQRGPLADAYRAEIERAIAAFPEDTMQLFLRWNHRLHAGDTAGAAADKERLLALGFQFPPD